MLFLSQSVDADVLHEAKEADVEEEEGEEGAHTVERLF